MTTAAELGLPDHVVACLFDLDGVLTETATIHAAAWKEMFDTFLSDRAKATGEPSVPFDAVTEYNDYVDGKTRLDGTRSFLESRHISLPEGAPTDPPGTQTINGLAETKNEIVLKKIAEGNVKTYAGSLKYLHAARDAGLHCAVVSSSANCAAVLNAAGIADLFETRVDGVTVETQHLEGKPSPACFIAAAHALGVEPSNAAVFEDALAGVQAGRSGGFGFVVGVNRADQAEALREHGADVVVSDLDQLLVNP